MNLTLEVISANGSSLGAGRRKVFGAKGGRIGRANDCDWVLPSPENFVSRHHATVECRSGQFYIKPESENGVGFNSPGNLMARPTAVKSGDRIFIDEYEILVNIAQEVRAPLIVGDPFADDEEGEPDDTNSLIPISELDPGELDPLRNLPAQPDTGASARRYVGVPSSSILTEPFTPPPLYNVPPPKREIPSNPARFSESAPAAIPNDWNDDQPEPKPAPPPRAAPPPPKPVVRPPPRPVVAPSPPPGRMTQPPPAPVMAEIPPPLHRQSQPPAQHQAQLAPVSPPARTPPKPSPPPRPSAGGAMDVDALLRAAGVDPASVPPDTAETLGRILLVAVQGTIDALRAREEVKAQFRLTVTRVRESENNPLAFALDANDAINTLLSRQNPGFLPPVEAFERAFNDIRGHQIAMLAGIRAAFESLMDRFDPQQLQEDFDRRAKRSGVLGVGKPKYWDLYADYFADLRGDRELTFRRLFGDDFGHAYEQQVEQIKQSRNAKKR